MTEHLEIYKIVVGTITANEGRRQKATATYLGMIAAIATVASAIPNLALIVPATIMLIIALIWLATLLYFRRLAQAKFAVIKEIEKKLALAAFEREWKYFKDKRVSFGLSLTYIEMVIPVVAAIGSFCYVTYWLVYRVFCSACSPVIF